MANLYSQYASGAQFTAGAIVGSSTGVSGLNPIVDRLNAITDTNGVITATSITTPLATTTVKGAASFNTNDFTVSSGAVSLKNKTSYWSCNGIGFIPSVSTKVVEYTSATGQFVVGEILAALASVNLPNGAVVTGVIVNGNAGANGADAFLYRVTRTDGASSAMATTVIGTEDTSISNATIDNSTYAYHIETGALSTNDIIYGARITYTTDYV